MCHNPSVYLCKLLFLEDRVIQSKSLNRVKKAAFLFKLESEVEKWLPNVFSRRNAVQSNSCRVGDSS